MATLETISGQLDKAIADFRSQGAQLEELREHYDELDARMQRASLDTSIGGSSEPKPGKLFSRADEVAFNKLLRAQALEKMGDHDRARDFMEGVPDTYRPQNTLSVGSTPGSHAIPGGMVRAAHMQAAKESPIAGLCRRFPIESGEGGRIDYLVSQNSVEARSVGEDEGNPSTSDQGDWYRVTGYLRKHAVSIPVTVEMLYDSNIDIAGLIAREAGAGFGRAMGRQILTGSGVGEMTGILTNAPVSTGDFDSPARDNAHIQYVPSGASAGFPKFSGTTADDVAAFFDVQGALQPGYLADAVWTMAPATWAEVRKLRNADGQPLWTPHMIDDQRRPVLAGYPVVLASHAPAIAADSNSILFGNWGDAFLIGDGPQDLLTDPYTSRGRVVYYWTNRWAGVPLDCRAMKCIRMSAS